MCNFGSNWLLTEDLVRVFPPIHENQALPGIVEDVFQKTTVSKLARAH